MSKKNDEGLVERNFGEELVPAAIPYEAPAVISQDPEIVVADETPKTELLSAVTVDPVQPDMDAILQYNAALVDLWRKHVWMRPTGLMHEICFIPEDIPGGHMRSAIHLLEMALAADGKVYIHKTAARHIEFPNLRKDGKFGDYLIFVRA